MDELQERVGLESSYTAFMLTLVLAFVLSGLAGAGIYRQSLDEVGTAMLCLWACAYIYSSWRYR